MFLEGLWLISEVPREWSAPHHTSWDPMAHDNEINGGCNFLSAFFGLENWKQHRRPYIQ